MTTANRDPCATVFAALDRPFYQAGESKNRDAFVQISDGQQAYIRHFEEAKEKCGLSPPSELLDSLKAKYAETVQERIEACDAPASDRHSESSFRAEVKFIREPCRGLLESALDRAPPERVWATFESHHTKKNYCDFLVEYINSEQAIIDRFESAQVDCSTWLDWPKAKHAKTSERRTKIYSAAAVDPDGLVSSYAK